MPKSTTKEYTAVYRQRLRDAGLRQVLFDLPESTLGVIDELKERQGLRSRSQALLQLIERGRDVTQEIT